MRIGASAAGACEGVSEHDDGSAVPNGVSSSAMSMSPLSPLKSVPIATAPY